MHDQNYDETHSQVGNEEYRKTERRVKAEANETEHTEECLHREVGDIVEHMESEEPSGRLVQSRQEVDDNVEDQDARR